MAFSLGAAAYAAALFIFVACIGGWEYVRSRREGAGCRRASCCN